MIYLEVDTALSQQLMSKRYHGDENKKDIHESNPEYLKRARLAAEYCAGKLRWTTVHCAVDGQMRSVEAIHREILKSL